MGKYGDINNSGTITSSDITAMFDYVVGDSALPNPLDSDEASRKFFCMNMGKKWAYSGPSFYDMLKLKQVQLGNLPAEDFWGADYNNNSAPAWDEPESGKGSYVDMNGASNQFVTSFPTLIDYASWSGPEAIQGQDTDMRETGGARTYTKDMQYNTEFNILPPTELYKTRTFEKSDFGLRSLAFEGNFMATSVYLHGEGTETPTTGSVFIYEKLPSGTYTFRHEIEVTDTTRAPVVEIHGDWLFVGNPLNHVVAVYSLSDFAENAEVAAKNETAPKQLLSPNTIQGEQVTDWYGSYLHCSDGVHLFVGVDNGRLEQVDVVNGNYTVDCGYIDVYKLESGEWDYVARITPPDLSIFQNDDSYGTDPADIQFGSCVYHRKNTIAAAEYVAVGAPRADTDSSFRGSDYIFNDTRKDGAVYVYKMTTVNDIPVFQFVHKESYQDSWFNSNITDSGEMEFGRSVVFDDEFSLWIASNPLIGSHVTRIPQLNSTSWDTANATHESISSDRLGGVLTTNGHDVVYGGPYKLRVFQSTTSLNDQTPQVLKVPEKPIQPTTPDIIDEKPIRPTQEIHGSGEQDKPQQHEFPLEWGQPPALQARDIVELPFGYGMGSSTIAQWIESNSTGDVRDSAYLRKLVREQATTEVSNYHELWNVGNPLIRVRVASAVGGVNVATPHGDIFVEKGSALNYKSITRTTIVVSTVGDLSGVAVYWEVNGQKLLGNTRLELLVCGEDMDVVVNFQKDEWENNDTSPMCAITREGKTTIKSKSDL